MGGSSLPADLLNDLCRGKLQLNIHRDYGLPQGAQNSDLVLCASFSGNTEETLSAWNAAKGFPRAALANGGRLAELARQEGQTFVQIPDCIQPRCATGYFIGALLGLLHRLQVVESHEALLQELAKFLRGSQATWEAQGQALAKELKGKVPVVYGPEEFHGLCRTLKIKFNENAKIQSFYNVFPELNHNEMVGYTQLLMPTALIYVRHSQMNPRVAKRMEVMTEVLPPEISVHEIVARGDSLWKTTFEALAVGDYTSYYLAKEYGIDPTPVAMVEDFKQRLV